MSGGVGIWYLEHGLGQKDFAAAKSEMAREAHQLRQSLQDRLAEVTAETVREELARTSMVVRDKAAAAGQAFMDATSDLRTSAAIKARLVQAPNLPGFKINVDTSGGIVTLSGTLESHDQVARAVKIALDTEGVTKVISTVQVR